VRVFGLTGFPIEHSFSPAYFKEKFIRLGLQDLCDYRLFPLQDISGIRAMASVISGLEGLNVTIPHKNTIIPFLDELDETASSVGAVNTIRISNEGTWKGYNTDVTGFRRSIAPFLRSEHHRALILGTGGSSRAVQFVLRQLGIDTFLVSRSASDFGSGRLCYQDLNIDFLRTIGLIVNTTPVGMWPEQEQMPPFPVEFFRPGQLVVDLIYRPSPTLFLRTAARHGAEILDGTSMLHQQADAAWEIWNK
jgi:shikimate dehydrogenase